jgi:hypothetical protein
MNKVGLKEELTNTIGRNFNLAFNQISMYNVYHKSVIGTLERLYDSLQDGFKIVPTIAISLNQEQIFIEDEQLDSRINTARLAAHFKKADIQSLAFESPIELGDLTSFLEIMTDLKRYPKVDKMKSALQEKGLDRFQINYFVYQKVKSDETVVHTSQVEDGQAGTGKAAHGDKAVPTAEDIFAIMAADILSEEVQKNISIQNMMQGPAEFSQMLIEEDLTAVKKAGDQRIQPGTALVHNINRFQQEVDQALSQKTDVNISELAEDVFKLKQQLLKGIEDQKAKGVVYLDEQAIQQEADQVTDGVLIKLITEEYNKESVTVKRLAQIVLRIVSDTNELQRILPKLKRALLASGMPMADYLQFVQELKDELQSDELAGILDRGAEEIGLDGEDLIQEIMKNPQDAAELIYLASEVRKSGEDEQVLSNLLVDYVERVGSELALNELKTEKDLSGTKVNSIFTRIRTELVGKLKRKELEDDVLLNIEKRLTERMDESIRQLKSTMVFRQMSADEQKAPSKEDILKLLQKQSKDEDELKEIVNQVKQALTQRGVEEETFQEIYDEIMTRPPKKKKEKPKAAPPGSLNRGSTLFVLEKEILRANRYDTPFSILSFSIVKASPKEALKPGSVKLEDIITTFVTGLTEIVRETDLVGMLSAQMVVVIQPMTEGGNAKIALDRITKALKSVEFKVKETPFDINFASIVTPYDAERTPDLKSFVKVAQTDLRNLAERISTVQSMI